MDARPRIRTFVGIGIGLALALGALGACGGGGGGGGPAISFTFASGATTLAEDAPAENVQVVLHTSLAATDQDVTVDVVDAGTGSATSGTDYTAFAPVTLTFPLGSVDGDSQTVALTPLDDLSVEAGNETVRLRLQNAVGGGVSGTSQFVATLTDIHAAAVDFATNGTATPDETTGPRSVALELDCGAGVTLGVAVSVRISDLRTGSATPSTDYAAFSARTVTFPVGSADGAIQTVDLTVNDDGTLEVDESVVLGLSQPSARCSLGANTTYTLTIHDDDLAGNAAFLPSEGATGTENALAYNQTIVLGTQTVGAGPNAGTLVRVTNGGGVSMHLGAPRIFGTNVNDFAVDIQSSSSPADEPSGFVVDEATAPLVARDDAGPGVALRLDPAALAHLRNSREVVLHDFALPDLGNVTLELRRRPLPFSDDAKLVVDGAEVAGGPRTLIGDLQIWSGRVAGMDGSRVFLALSSDSVQGFVELPGELDRTVHFLADGPGQVRLLRDPELAALGIAPPANLCGGELFAPNQSQAPALAQDPDAGAALTVADCRVAFETDWQLYQEFGSSVLLTNYVTSLVAAVSDQYFTDVQATLSIAYLGIHTTSNDGWTSQDSGGDSGALLSEFRGAWGSSWPATANLAHFLSGANLGGGVAYVDVLCNQSFGFGVSGNLSGNINWAVWTGAPGNFTWDFVVVAHELGHNFGSQHTHDYCPPLDRCYSNCSGTTSCSRGTIMSYCHTCGGMSNVDLYFHPVTANIMRQRINASCLDDAVLIGGDFVQYRVRFNPLTTTGAKSATLEFTHDATNATKPFRLQLSGTAN